MIDTISPIKETEKAFENNWQSIALGSFLWNLYIVGYLLVICLIGALIIYSIDPADFQEDYVYDIVILIIALSAIGPFSAGYTKYLLNVIKRKKSDFGLLLSGFRDFGKTFLIGFYCWVITFGSLMIYLGIIILLQLILPAIADNLFFRIIVVAVGSWYLISIQLRIMWIPYFINEEVGHMLSSWAIVRKSCELMEGKTTGLLILLLRFTGWNVISVITFGIGWFWVFPYTVGSVYNYYCEVRGNISEPLLKPSERFRINKQGELSYLEWSVDRTVTVVFIILFWTIFLSLAFLK